MYKKTGTASARFYSYTFCKNPLSEYNKAILSRQKFPMTELTELQRFALEHKMFWWWVSDVTKLNEEAIVEGTVMYGDFPDKKKLLSILGTKKFQSNLTKLVTMPRSSIRPETTSYWLDYIQTHA
jgi:hypothetical protein